MPSSRSLVAARRSRRRSAICLCLVAVVCLLASSLSQCVSGGGVETLQLEPGEVVLDSAVERPTMPLDEGPSTNTAATCDSAQSRKARQIVHDLFLSQLPTGYFLPLTCPFHPSLDLLLAEDSSKQRVVGRMWKCLRCSRVFQTQEFVDQHIQHRHMQRVGQNAVCLADMCDILDCYHRTVSFDPLTGDVLTGGEAGSIGVSARARRIEAARAQEAGMSSEAMKRAYSGILNDDGPQHPHAHRCSDESMARARLKCQSLLLQCLPFIGTNEHATGLPSKEVHALYDKLHLSMCEPLRCTEDGLPASALGIVASRSAETRARFATIGFILLIFGIGVFYFLAWILRSEFGWKAGAPGAGAALTAHRAKERPVSRFASWLGLQQKKRLAPSKLI